MPFNQLVQRIEGTQKPRKRQRKRRHKRKIVTLYLFCSELYNNSRKGEPWVQCWGRGQRAHRTWVGYGRDGSFSWGFPYCESHRTKADMYVNTYHTSVRPSHRHNRQSCHTPTPFQCKSCCRIRTFDHRHNLEIKPECTCLLNATIYFNFKRVKFVCRNQS